MNKDCYLKLNVSTGSSRNILKFIKVMTQNIPAKLLMFVSLMLTAGAINIAQAQPVLKDVFKNDFLIGVAVNSFQFTGRDTVGDRIIATQFNSVSPENVLKWQIIQPGPDKYNFEPGDQYVAFGEKHHMFIIGHTLVWHHQTPRWVFEGKDGKPADRKELLKRMRDHIMKVVGRYKGKIKGWDVVNEALNEDGTLRESPWLKIIGPDFIEKAFEYAHEADPDAELYYNDYSMTNKAKRQGAIKIYKDLRAKGIPITAVGCQMHFWMPAFSLSEVDSMLNDFKSNGIKVMGTELDMGVLPYPGGNRGGDISINFKKLSPAMNPYKDGLPDSVATRLDENYNKLFKIFMKYKDDIKRITFWGARNSDSWLNNWPIPGRTNYPLLFGRDGKPNSAFYAVIKAAGE